jgi:hypothetical protein
MHVESGIVECRLCPFSLFLSKREKSPRILKHMYSSTFIITTSYSLYLFSLFKL